MRTMQRDFYFFGKGTRNLLPAEYGFTAEMLEMPLQKRSKAKRCADKIRDSLRSLRQTRPRSVSAENRTFRAVPRLFSGKPDSCQSRLKSEKVKKVKM